MACRKGVTAKCRTEMPSTLRRGNRVLASGRLRRDQPVEACPHGLCIRIMDFNEARLRLCGNVLQLRPITATERLTIQDAVRSSGDGSEADDDRRGVAVDGMYG